MGGTRRSGGDATLTVGLGFGVQGLGWPDVAPAVGVCGHHSAQEVMRFHVKRRLRSRSWQTGALSAASLFSFALGSCFPLL